MDPPPLPPLPTPTTLPVAAVTACATTTMAAAAPSPPAAATSIHLNCPDSVESSPRSRAADLDDLPPVPGAKLRLMCSYGGHIIPRPHDKALSYIGGETRLVVVDRHSSLSCFCSRLSRNLVHGRPFTLKYQLPHEDLDSLVSIATDEDLENMIEEYDRISTTASSLTPARIRLFLFFTKPETTASMGSLLDDAKSETWFVDALNGSGLLPRNLSDSAAMDCLVNLDNDSNNGLEAQAEGENNKQVKNSNVVPQDTQHSMPDSPMLDNGSSSFGSSSSSPSLSNLPPIRVRIDQDQKAVGMGEQFAQMTFAQVVQKHDDGFGILTTPGAAAAAAAAMPPPLPVMTVAVADSVSVASSSAAYSAGVSRILSDDERLDQGMPVAFRKPPLPLQPVQNKAGTHYNLPSPDSVASDCSIASASSLSKHINYQDHTLVPTRETTTPGIPNTMCDDSQIQTQESWYGLPQQSDQQQQQLLPPLSQQQFVYPSMHYIPHPAPSPVPMSTYYPVYAPPPPPSQQQQLHHPMDQQYPMYAMPVPQTQPTYNMAVQPNVGDTTTVVASSRPPTPPNPTIVTTPAMYKDAHLPIYSTKAAALSPAKPEVAANVCRTAVTSTPQLVQVPASQFQQQYVGFSQVHHHPSQSIAVAPAASANYGCEYANAAHDQVYYAQHQAGALPPQYQSMTPAAAATALADAAKQLPADNSQQ